MGSKRRVRMYRLGVTIKLVSLLCIGHKFALSLGPHRWIKETFAEGICRPIFLASPAKYLCLTVMLMQKFKYFLNARHRLSMQIWNSDTTYCVLDLHQCSKLHLDSPCLDAGTGFFTTFFWLDMWSAARCTVLYNKNPIACSFYEKSSHYGEHFFTRIPHITWGNPASSAACQFFQPGCQPGDLPCTSL